MAGSVERRKKGAIFKKFAYALRGIWVSLKEETSLVIHFVAGILILILGVVFRKSLSWSDWSVLILSIGLVITVELMNTAVENLVDLISFKYNMNSKKIKDVAAASTLVIAIAAILVGCFIFLPIFVELLGGGLKI